MVKVKTKLCKQAKQKEDLGEYNRASNLYVRSAFERLATTGFRTGPEDSNTLLSVGDLLRGIFCAVQFNSSKAESIQIVTQGILELLQSQTSNPCVQGILFEWTGDSRLIIAKNDCMDYYRNSLMIYEHVDIDEQRNWGVEPEIDYAYWAFEDFVSWSKLNGVPTTDTPLQMDFLARIHFKQEIAKSILSDDGAEE